MIHQYYKISLKNAIQFRITRYHLKRNSVHNRDATLARHIERLGAIATSCGSATPWQSLNRLPVGYIRSLTLVPRVRVAPSSRRACVAHAQGSAGGVNALLAPGRMPERLPSLGNVHPSVRADICC